MTSEIAATPRNAALGRSGRFCSYHQARDHARRLGIRTQREWRQRCRRTGNLPDNIPADPEDHYAGEFKAAGGWPGFLGAGVTLCSYEDAANAARRLGIASLRAWRERLDELRALMPPGTLLPANPAKAYREDFRRRGHASGFFNKRPRFATYAQASHIAQSHGVTSAAEWLRLAKRYQQEPSGTRLPTNPDKTYRADFDLNNGWWGFLGKAAPSTFVSYQEAKAWCLEHGVLHSKDWARKCRLPGFRPPTIPSNPHKVYAPDFQNNGGWPGFCAVP